METEIRPIKDERKEGSDRLSDDHWVIENAPAGVTKRQLEALTRRLKISNYLLNPVHPDIARVSIISTTDYVWDRRMERQP